jgi:tRNA(Ile)-lysidine synthase
MELSKGIREEFDRFDFKNHKYLLAYSGGPDSVYLLWMLSFYYQDQLKDHIAICYINYHDSPFVDQEEKLVYDYVKRFGIKIYKDDVHYHKEQDKNFEEWARNYRYDLFEKIVKEEGFDGLLTAHQKTDHVETYILQKKRGNLPTHYGLRNINYYHDMALIRPILSISKKELTDQLDNNQLPYYDDITNQDPHKARTNIRKELTEEEIEEYCLKIQEENKLLDQLYQEFESYQNKLSFETYNRFDEDKKKRYCFYLLDSNNLKVGREGFGKRIFDFLKKNTSGTLKLNDDLILYRTTKEFFLAKDYSKISYSFHFDKPGIYQNEYFTIDLTDISKFNLKDLPVEIRNYHPGDRISTNLPTKDIRKALQKQGVPFYLLSCYPVFIVEGNIRCVPFYKDILDEKIPLKLHF